MSNAVAMIAASTNATPTEIESVIKSMIISTKKQHGAVATQAEFALVASVCAKYDLNPLVKEVAAFSSNGKLQLVVMIDGWYKMVNRQPDFDGVEFVDTMGDNGRLISVECKMFIKNRCRPVCVTEYMSECHSPASDIWKRWPNRMLRHKAYIQAARMAFGISEAVDDDEARRMGHDVEKDVTPTRSTSEDLIRSVLMPISDMDKLKAEAAQLRERFQITGTYQQNESVLMAVFREVESKIKAGSEQAPVVIDAEAVVVDDDFGA